MSTTPRKDDSHLFTSVRPCQLKVQEEQQPQEKYVIAQPIFVFEKGEHNFKRPAEDSLDEAAELEFTGFLRKRVRSSSVTLRTTDSQSLGVRKNNVFMTSRLLQRNDDMNNVGQGPPVRPSDHVLRPAVLQPSRTQSCQKGGTTLGPGASKTCETKENTEHKISEADSSLLSENLSNARSSVQMSTDPCISEAPSGGHPKEDECSFTSCSSDFVFGENMVERVLGTQKLTQHPLQNLSYAKEKSFKSLLKFPNVASNSEPIKNISLIESAAAFSSKPSQKCLLEKIDVITGEETEHNVLKINCKIFVFNKATQSWSERGQGVLRLNDTAGSECGTLQSRLS